VIRNPCQLLLNGSTTGVWPTMLQAAKRGASSLPLLPLTKPPQEKYYFHSLPRVALLSHTSPPPYWCEIHSFVT